MKIETKFNIGDSFVAIKDGKAESMKVASVGVFVYADRSTISYTPEGSYSKSFQENECFKSKDELIKSL